MKKVLSAFLGVLAGIVVAISMVFTIMWIKYPRWTVEPAPDGKWRSCYETSTGKGCSSPISYDEALWWSKTEGGKKNAR